MEFKNTRIIKIVNDFAALEELEKKGNSPLKLPAALAWKRRLNKKALANIADEIDAAMKEITDFYSDDEHSVPNPDNADARIVKEEYRAEFGKKKLDILNQSTDVEIRTIKSSELPDELTDVQMNTLDFMVEEE